MKLFATALLTVLITTLTPRPGFALTNAEFVTLPIEQQGVYISASVDMIAHLSYLKDQQQSKCITDWYYNGEGALKSIHGNIKNYGESRPTSIIIALIKRECGPLN